MALSIAVIGNSGLNIGAAMAGDLALAGHDVRFQLWADQRDCLDAVRASGGIQIDPPSAETISGRSGLGTPRVLTDDPAEAVLGAELVVMDVAALELEERATLLIPHLENGQVLHVNTHGYWPALRLAPALRAANKEGVIVTEGVTPTLAAGRSGATITPHFLRRQLPVAAFPATRRQEAMSRLAAITPSVEPRLNVIETNLESMNLLVHPAMALLNVGYFDRAESEGRSISFYGTGNTVHAGRLAEQLDAERPAVCEAFGVRFRSLLEHIQTLYGGSGTSVYEAVGDSPFYKQIGELPAHIWRTWLAADVPLAHVPFVLLAESVGLQVPLHRGFIDLIDALLGMTSWQEGLTLQRLGLDGMEPDQIATYATTGDPGRSV